MTTCLTRQPKGEKGTDDRKRNKKQHKPSACTATVSFSLVVRDRPAVGAFRHIIGDLLAAVETIDLGSHSVAQWLVPLERVSLL